MTWEELKEEAKKMGAEIVISIFADEIIEKIIFNNVAFYSDGGVCGIYEREDGSTYCGSAFTQDRTPDQMFAIMKALTRKDVKIELEKKVEHLQEQLTEANEIIKGFSKLYEVYPSGNGIIIFNVVKPPSLENYLKKWSVK